MTEIAHLICEYRTNPLGIDVRTPHLGWQMQTERLGARQTAYQLMAASQPELISGGQPDLWDSGKVESDQSVHVPYAGEPLHSRQRVYWGVKVWDETGNDHESEPAWFETGLFQPSDWQAKWIGAAFAGGPRSTFPVPYLRKTFMLPAEVVSEND